MIKKEPDFLGVLGSIEKVQASLREYQSEFDLAEASTFINYFVLIKKNGIIEFCF
jgi:hypothetical protein